MTKKQTTETVEEEKPYRGFTDDSLYYYIGDKKWKLKKVFGHKPAEFREKFKEITKENDKPDRDIIKLVEMQDDLVKDLLPEYFEGFDYEKEIQEIEPGVLRNIAGDVITFLVLGLVDKRELNLLTNRSMMIQKQMQNS